MLESCKLKNAGSEKSESFNSILSTLRRRFRRSWEITGLLTPEAVVAGEEAVPDVATGEEEEIRFSVGAAGLKKI